MNSPFERLASLRSALKQNNLDAYIIPLSDPHLGENIPDHWKIITWLTGFTGSAANVAVTDSFAGLWTDSRYFLQAEKQLEGTGIDLIIPKTFQPSDYTDWLADHLPAGSTIGLDGRSYSITNFRKLKHKVEGKGIVIVSDSDLVSDIWKDRPPLPFSEAWDHPVEYAGKNRHQKISEVRKEMERRNLDYHLLTSVDDIMWLLNIRGNDMLYSPLLTSFALIGKVQIILFVEERKIPKNLASEFDKLGILILPYEEIVGLDSFLSEGSTILINPATTSVNLYNSIPAKLKIVEDVSIPSRMKAVRNKTEIENIGKTMIKDGIALTKFFHWIENDLGVVPMTEVSLAGRLLEFRMQQEGFLSPSFPTITALNEHAALPHYEPTPESDSIIGESGIFLVDSGGQYMGGTTDITRTISIGPPTAQQKQDFTVVLKGHIALALAKFPAGTKGYQLDLLARKALWEKGLNYGHGTGHGVGYCLNVHEGPQNISPADIKINIEPGMLISNEPALYREGEYGIRTENLILCYEDEETEFGQFMKFDTVSLCYIDKNLIDKSLLDQEEIDWLNEYHSEVYDKISPQLTNEEELWLREKTGPI